MIKNVLIVSNNSLSDCNNNGKTLNSLFEDFGSVNRVAQLYFNKEMPESSFVENFYRVSAWDQIKSFFDMKGYSAGNIIEIRSKLESGVERWGVFRRHVINFLNRHLETEKLLIRDFLFFGLERNTRALDWVLDFKPDCIFLVAGNNQFAINYAIFLSENLGIPLVSYITDDYVIENSFSGLFGNIYFRKLNSRYRALFKKCSKVFFIGDVMRFGFYKKFGISGAVLINCELFKEEFDVENISSDIRLVRVVFAGGLHLGRADAIIEFYRIFRECCSLLEIEPCLDVYTHQTISSSIINEFKKNCINFKGAASGEILENKVRQADFLLHAESCNLINSKRTMYSVSTKLPEYLSSGVCVIGYGPPEIASMRLLIDNEVGVFVDCKKNSKVEDLIKCISDVQFRQNISKRANFFVRNNFSPNIIRSRLKNCFLELGN